MALAPMRTIEKGYAEYKTGDPYTCVTKSAFRRWVVTGVIPSVKVGNKYLVNMDQVRAFLSGDNVLDTSANPTTVQGIRRLEV